MTSQFVTDIYIQVPEGIKKEDIRKELYQVGLKPGVYKKSIDRKEIRDHIMLKFNDVAYLSINVKGTNIFVTVTKKAETLKSVEQSNYCNIIAKKDGIIEKVIARSGNSVVQKGDIVRKGDVLINGSNNKSIPEVWATTFYEASKSASYEEVVKEKTGNKKNVYTLSFYDNKYTIRRNIKYNDYVIENQEYKLSLGNYTFPLKLKVSTFYETEDKKIEKDKLYSDDINALSEYRNTDLDKIERMDIIKLERKSNIYDHMTFYGKIKWTVSGMEGVYDETCEYHIGVDVDSGEYKLISFEIQDK